MTFKELRQDCWVGHRTVYVYEIKPCHKNTGLLPNTPPPVVVGIQYCKHFVLTKNGMYSRRYYIRKRRATKRDARKYD